MIWLLCCFVILQVNVLQVLSKTGDLECRSSDCEFVCGLNQNCYYQICTGKTATIKCSKGVIALTSTSFGRTSATVCPHDNTKLINCTANATLSETQNSNAMRYCNNDTSCSFTAAFDFQDDCGVDMWGDPCKANPKYLTINFTCVDKAETNLWSSWGPWSTCSKSCDKGNQTRWRNCTDVPEKKCTKTTCSSKGFSNESQVENCNNFSCISSTVMSSVTLQSTTYQLLSSTVVVSSQISSSFHTASTVSSQMTISQTPSSSLVVSANISSSLPATSISSQISSSQIPSSSAVVSSEISSSLQATSPVSSQISSSSAAVTSQISSLLEVTYISSQIPSSGLPSSNMVISSQIPSSLWATSFVSIQFSASHLPSSSSVISSQISSSLQATSSVSSQMATSSVSSQMATSSVSSQMATSSVSSQMATSSVSSQMATSSVSSQMATPSVPSQMATTKRPLSSMVASSQISSSFQVASSSLNLYFKSTNAISMIVSSTSSIIPFSSSNINVSSSIVHPTSSKIHPSTSFLSSSSIILVPTEKPPTPSLYVNVTLTLIWSEFCKSSDEFREGIAKLLTKRLKEKQDSDQVIIFNMDNCKTNPDETAAVKFYIAVKGSTKPNEKLTALAAELLLELINNGESMKLGQHFGNGTLSALIVVSTKKTDDNDPGILSTWLIILIIIAIIVFLIWLFCCLCVLCRQKNEKKQPERRITFTPFDVYEIPMEKLKEEDDIKDELRSFTSSVKIMVKDKPNEGVENPLYEMDFIPKAPSLMPIKLNIPTDDGQPDNKNEENNNNKLIGKDEDSKSNSSTRSSEDESGEETFPPLPTPGITRVYIGGKLVKEIGKDDEDKTITVKMSSL